MIDVVMRHAVYILFIIHIRLLLYRRNNSLNVIPEEEQVCTNNLKIISASRYFFYTVLVDGRCSL